ncbi:MAG: peptide deformylase [Paludibacter sp.]|jgi:peptide deformylase|nr:peptide deformylase [Paludibacter sp.]
MILPIYTYGSAVLRKVATPIDKNYPNLKELIENMFDTMHNSEGVGLAAPQIGLSIRLLVADLMALKDDHPELADFKIVMINPEILQASDEKENGEEGCLSIPGIHENVVRHKTITVKYFDSNFIAHSDTFVDYKARVIQHEIDHLDGNVFTDKVSPIRRQFIKTKLTNIIKGRTPTKYKIAK